MATSAKRSAKPPGRSSARTPDPGGPQIGLALGGGGARGLAHIAILEAFDELGLRPHAIAGASIGAFVGAAYAAGRPASDLRSETLQLFRTRRDMLRRLVRRDRPLRSFGVIDPRPRTPAFFRGEVIVELLLEEVTARDFSDLVIPLKVVAADFWNRSQVVIDSGPLVPALSASMALPGLFKPQVIDERVLIDGGTVNPVPYDLLAPACDLLVAVDLSAVPSQGRRELPTTLDAIFASYQIMQRTIVEEKVLRQPPDILIRPEITSVRLLEFFRVDEVLNGAQAAKEDLKRQLDVMVNRL